MIASKIYRDIKPVLFNPIGSLQLCMANEGILTDRVQTHIGPVWEGVRTRWIREVMERDEETKSCHSDNFPAAPFKHLRHLSPSLMLPNFDFLLLMRLYIQIVPSISLSVCLYFRMGVLRVNLKFLERSSWFSKSGKLIWLSRMDTVTRAVTTVGFAIFKYSDHLIWKTCVKHMDICQTGVIVSEDLGPYYVSECRCSPHLPPVYQGEGWRM